MDVVLLFYPQGIPEVYRETTLFSAHYHVVCLGHCGSASSFRNAMAGHLENMLPFKTSDMSSIRGTTCPVVSRCGTFSCPQGPHQIQHPSNVSNVFFLLTVLPWKLEPGNIWARFHATKLVRKKPTLLKLNVKNAMEHCFVWSRLSLVSRALAGALHWARKLPQICVLSLARTQQKQGSNRQRMATALSFRGW